MVFAVDNGKVTSKLSHGERNLSYRPPAHIISLDLLDKIWEGFYLKLPKLIYRAVFTVIVLH